MKPFRPAPDDDPLRHKFATTRRELSACLIERDEEVDLVLTALVAQEHVLLVGPPGTAKSLLLDSLMRWTSGKKFSVLLTRFSTPEDVFGPISVAGLKSDTYRRIVTNKLPEADLVFVDEVFRASSAILNCLLKVLNERTYDVGDGTSIKVPLKLAVAASNEWPSPETSKELSALFDRLLLRKTVQPIRTSAGRDRLLWGGDHTPKLSTSVTAAELDDARRQAFGLGWAEEASQALRAILQELHKEGIQPGDRRLWKSVGVTRAYAWLNGASQVEPEHLEVLQHVLWDDPIEQPQKVAQVIAKIANPTGMRLNQFLLECEQILSSTNVGDLASAATAAAKLADIDKSLATLKGNGRVERARLYVREQIRKLKLASIEAI
jgi:MoxR-like ATPase